MKLYLCEKPSQGEAVAKFLGMTAVHKKRGYYQKDNVLVTWAVGHLFKLQPPEYYKPELKKKWDFSHLPITPEPHRYEYVLGEKSKSQYTIIKKLLQKTDELFISTDPDPEGECIARNIIEMARYQGDMYRVLYNATDKKSLTRAFSSPQPAYKTEWMFNVARARAQSDWVVGMNLTMAMTLIVQKLGSSQVRNKAFPIGRVKTPTSMLVYLREVAIKRFKPTKFYSVEVDVFTEGQDVFTITFDVPDKFLVEGKLLDCSFAEKVKNYIEDQKIGVISEFTTETKSIQPPLPYELTTLQSACDKYDLGPDETLDILQSLYVKPFSATTYPRTNIPYLPDGLQEDISETVGCLLSLGIFDEMKDLLDLKKRTKAWDEKKVKVHHGIIPTTNKIDFTRLTQKQKAIYVLLSKRYLAQFLPDYTYEHTKAVVKLGELNCGVTFNVPVNLGWRVFESSDKEDKTQELPKLASGQKVGVKAVRVIEGQTKKPGRYTKASLAVAMENIASQLDDPTLKATLNDNDGIGTVATRATIIKELVKNGLLIEEKRQLKPSSLLEKYVMLIPNQLKEPANTALWERGFEAIQEGTITKDQFVEFQSKFVISAIEELKLKYLEIK